MTLRDLTPRQRQRLISRCKKDWKYWQYRLTLTSGFSAAKTNEEKFQVAYNCGVKAVLDILLTPKPPKDGKKGT